MLIAYTGVEPVGTKAARSLCAADMISSRSPRALWRVQMEARVVRRSFWLFKGMALRAAPAIWLMNWL